MNTTGNITQVHHHTELENLISLDQQFFPGPWQKCQWSDLDLQHHFVLKWNHGQTSVGFALFGRVEGDDTAHLYKILLSPEFQGTGEAMQFWALITDFLRSKLTKHIYLEVESSNEKAVRFYKKVGFTCLKQVKGYYSNGSDGLMLQLTL